MNYLQKIKDAPNRKYIWLKARLLAKYYFRGNVVGGTWNFLAFIHFFNDWYMISKPEINNFNVLDPLALPDEGSRALKYLIGLFIFKHDHDILWF